MIPHTKYYLFLCSGIVILITLTLNMAIQSTAGQSSDVSATSSSLSPLYIATTRNYVGNNNVFMFDTIKLTNFSLDKFGGSCPEETAIYIHGFSRDQTEAGEEFNRLLTSLDHNFCKAPRSIF